MPPTLDVRHLSVSYLTDRGPAPAVDDVSIRIGAGEVVGLAGESGSGKSTVALAIMRLLRMPALITGGQVLVEGEDVLAMEQEAVERLRWTRVAMVFQSAMNALNPVATIGDHFVETLRQHRPMSPSQAQERAAELLRIVNIPTSRLGSYPHQLSGGMRQRVAIALALALDPSLVIMDEPTTALDVVVQREILQQIAELQRIHGFAMLFITHDLSLLMEISTRIAIMYAGQVVEVADARELHCNPLHPYTQGLLESFPSIRGPLRRMEGIRGAPPNLLDLPGGCRFHPRCSQVEPAFTQAVPRLKEVVPGHWVACHLYDRPEMIERARGGRVEDARHAR